jgi:hypothetical protein
MALLHQGGLVDVLEEEDGGAKANPQREIGDEFVL